MGLKEDLIEATKEGRLRQNLIRQKGTKVLTYDFKDSFKAAVGDCFNSRYLSLDNLCELSDDLSNDDAFKLYAEFGIQGFLPDVLPMGILAFVKENDSSDPDIVSRYKVTQLLPKESNLGIDGTSIDDKSNVVLTEFSKKKPGETEVTYYRNKSNIGSKHKKKVQAIKPHKKYDKSKKKAPQVVAIKPHSEPIITNAVKPYVSEPQKHGESVETICKERTKYGVNGTETLEKYGDVMKLWETHYLDGVGEYNTLSDKENTFNPQRVIRAGDVFSAILMGYKKDKEGKGNYRIFQFQKNGYIGYVYSFNPGLYDIPLVPHRDLHSQWVYRLAVFATKNKQGTILYCNAIEMLFGKDAVSLNFVKSKHVSLPKRDPPEFTKGNEYMVGVEHIIRDKPNMGLFFDATLPNMKGIVYFKSHVIHEAKTVKLGKWAIVRVSDVKYYDGNKMTVNSDFVRFVKI